MHYVTLFSVEMMPTVIRGQASAIANAMGTLFTIASPYIAHSVRQLEVN